MRTLELAGTVGCSSHLAAAAVAQHIRRLYDAVAVAVLVVALALGAVLGAVADEAGGLAWLRR